MQIQVNTDHNIEGHEALAGRIGDSVKNALGQLGTHITRVEVHVTDEDSNKKGGKDGMRCVMEARLKRHQPVAATHEAVTLDQAVDGAADKLARLIENTLGRIDTQRTRRTDPPLPEEKLDPEP